jgi:hypothetical protein
MTTLHVIEWGEWGVTVHASHGAAMDDYAGRPRWERDWAATHGVDVAVEDVPEGAVWSDGALGVIEHE